jgi:shikimate kinase
VAPVVALTGFMGSGKTSVGRTLADGLGWRFGDLDDEIEQRSGRSIALWFREVGEVAFREYEARALAAVLAESAARECGGTVLALGGGTVAVERSVSLLQKEAFVVYLAVTPAVAWARVQGSGRPLATDESAFTALARERESLYLASADAVVESGGRPVVDVVGEVLAVLAERGIAA